MHMHEYQEWNATANEKDVKVGDVSECGSWMGGEREWSFVKAWLRQQQRCVVDELLLAAICEERRCCEEECPERKCGQIPEGICSVHVPESSI